MAMKREAFEALSLPTHRSPPPRRLPTVATGTISSPAIETVASSDEAEQRALDDLRSRYAIFGGLLPCEDLLHALRRGSDRALPTLACWIARERVVAVPACGTWWVPVAHVDVERCRVRPGVARVMSELVPAFDVFEIAQWFVQPNCWLDHRCPMECLATDPAHVADVARADRFVASGWG